MRPHVDAQIAAGVERFQAETAGEGVGGVAADRRVLLEVGLHATEVLLADGALFQGHGLAAGVVGGDGDPERFLLRDEADGVTGRTAGLRRGRFGFEGGFLADGDY